MLAERHHIIESNEPHREETEEPNSNNEDEDEYSGDSSLTTKNPEINNFVDYRVVKLIKIPIFVQFDGFTVDKVISWNVNEQGVSPEQYSQVLANSLEEDEGYQFAPFISSQIRLAILTSSENDVIKQPRFDLPSVKFIVKLDLAIQDQIFYHEFDYPLYPKETESPRKTAQIVCEQLNFDQIYVNVIEWTILKQLCCARLTFDSQYLFSNINFAPVVPVTVYEGGYTYGMVGASIEVGGSSTKSEQKLESISKINFGGEGNVDNCDSKGVFVHGYYTQQQNTEIEKIRKKEGKEGKEAKKAKKETKKIKKKVPKLVKNFNMVAPAAEGHQQETKTENYSGKRKKQIEVGVQMTFDKLRVTPLLYNGVVDMPMLKKSKTLS